MDLISKIVYCFRITDPTENVGGLSGDDNMIKKFMWNFGKKTQNFLALEDNGNKTLMINIIKIREKKITTS